MTKEEAEALERFIKDHDTRFQAASLGGDGGVFVQLTTGDGKTLAPVHSLAEYGSRFIEDKDPGPTIREAWERFRKG